MRRNPAGVVPRVCTAASEELAWLQPSLLQLPLITVNAGPKGEKRDWHPDENGLSWLVVNDGPFSVKAEKWHWPL